MVRVRTSLLALVLLLAVTATGLVVRTPEEHLVVPWHEVEDLFRRGF